MSDYLSMMTTVNASTMFKLAMSGWVIGILALVLMFLGYQEIKWIAVLGIVVGVGAIFAGAIANLSGSLKNDLKNGDDES